MRIFILLITILFTCNIVTAQEQDINIQEQDTLRVPILQKLNINQDPRLEKMLKWHINKNVNAGGMKGFRVEIFFSSDMNAKEKALEKKAEFLSVYPDYVVHIKYDAPNFRVRVGDFRTKSEALKLYEQIKNDYPVAFIVPDKIDFPILKTDVL